MAELYAKLSEMAETNIYNIWKGYLKQR